MAHTVYIRFTVFSNFSKLQFVLHILTFRNFYSGDAHHANYGKHISQNTVFVMAALPVEFLADFAGKDCI